MGNANSRQIQTPTYNGTSFKCWATWQQQPFGSDTRLMFGSIRSRTPVPVLSIDSISSRPSRVGQLRRILEQLEQRLGDDAGYVALRIPNIINPAFAKWLAHRSGYLQYTMNSLPDFVYMPSYVANVEGGMSPLQQSHHL